jgi:hypothetical protein
MKSAVCTLWEAHYHLGLAAFVNSLHAHGYRGGVWAGYRGPLPPWAAAAIEREGVREFTVADGLKIHFVPVETNRHLTNFKPDFLADARARFFPTAENVFYFDPDILLKCPWSFFEGWAGCGVALCEDINSPMPSTHPIRIQWQRYYAPHGLVTARALDIYVNGGFIGVSRENWAFVELWQRIQDLMAPAVADLAGWNYPGRDHIFQKTDQDALNIATMFSSQPVSIVGKEGMDLVPGGFLMSHALGAPKPWAKDYLREVFHGFSPTSADRHFWEHAGAPIPVFSKRKIAQNKFRLRLAAVLSRFYRRT